MIPGPTVIRKCMHCKQHLAEETITSGNTFGATFWTDGKQEAPMLPDQPWLVKCPHCGELVWIDELETIKEIEPFEADTVSESWYPTEPSFEEYISFLQGPSLDIEKERYVRLRAWWTGNDPRRENGEKQLLSEIEVQNLWAFSELLDLSDTNNRILKAEIQRELGRFDEALALLSEIEDERLFQAVNIIKKLAEGKQASVSRMDLE